MSVLEKCREACKANPRRVVFADALDARVLQAADKLREQGLVKPVLIGNPFALRDLASRSGVLMPRLEVVDPERSNRIDQFVEAYAKHKDASIDSARQAMHQPLFYAAMMVRLGQADVCIAGNLSTTGDVLRAALNVIGVAPGSKTVSSFFLMSSPDGSDIRVFADGGVVPEPSAEQLADITIDAANSFEKLMGQQARVAMLSFSTKGSSDHPSARRVRQAYELVRSRSPGMVVDGELQFDAAVIPAVAKQKAPDSPLQGDSNVMIFPSLDAGNIAYKMAQRLCHYQALGPLIQGLKQPMHDLSRGCSTNDIADIAVLGSYLVSQ